MTNIAFHYIPITGSGKIRGYQIGEYLQGELNPDEINPESIHIWIKKKPIDGYPKHTYLDIVDAQERVSWLAQHTDVEVIASSLSSLEYLRIKLPNSKIHLIPQHHCNFERFTKDNNAIKTAGLIGVEASLQLDVEELKESLRKAGIEFKWLIRARNREQVYKFYKTLDVQIIFRKRQGPLKNPLKIVNAMSFGIPTIACPEIGYKEIENYYWKANSINEIIDTIKTLQPEVDRSRLIEKAEEYHIENIAKLYRRLT